MENVIVASVSAPASTSQAQAPRRWGRSTGAVVTGLLAIVVTHTGMDAILHASGVFPPSGYGMSDALFGLALAYRVLFSVLGCALTARLAPARPLKHALVLGAIGTVASLGGLLAMIARSPALGPVWYPLALVLTSLPCAWLGAKLTAKRAGAAAR